MTDRRTMARAGRREVLPLDLVAGGASTGAEGQLLIEEQGDSPVPFLRKKGNLYLLAHGMPGLAAGLLCAIRDQYYGDPTIARAQEVPLGLLDSFEAGADLLGRQEEGVSCLAAAVYFPNRLALLGVGECRGFVATGSGSVQLLLAPSYPHQKLGKVGRGPSERVQRLLVGGDRVILCCGALAKLWGINEVRGLLAGPLGQASSQELADDMVNKASSQGAAGAVVVISCLDRPASSWVGRVPSQAEGAGGEQGQRQRGYLPSSRPGLMGYIFGRHLKLALGVFVLAMVAAMALRVWERPPAPLPVAAPSPTPLLLATPTEGPASLWARVDALWPQAERGEVAAWREIVGLLERLQAVSPGDATVLEKLRSATFNLAYWEKLEEVATLWGRGDTSATTVESWGKAVEVLEGLHKRMLELGYVKPLVDKLYSAQVNYGKALEAAGRLQEARAIYERARQLIFSRPEAVDALRTLLERATGGGD